MPVDKVFEMATKVGQLLIAAVAILLAIWTIYEPTQIRDSESTAIFLGVALAGLFLHKLIRVRAGNMELEFQQLEEKVDTLINDVAPGKKGALAPVVAESVEAEPKATPKKSRVERRTEVDPEDPNKNQFGGKSRDNGRELVATVTPADGPNSSRCQVNIRVQSTDPNKPLAGEVVFHLHPTFGSWTKYTVDVENGIAEDTIWSYGAFTIGIEADKGKTRLELDLAKVAGGTKKFYQY